MNTIVHRISKCFWKDSFYGMWCYAMLSYGMIWYGKYGMLWDFNAMLWDFYAMLWDFYAMVYVVKDMHSATVTVRYDFCMFKNLNYCVRSRNAVNPSVQWWMWYQMYCPTLSQKTSCSWLQSKVFWREETDNKHRAIGIPKDLEFEVCIIVLWFNLQYYMYWT